MSDPATGQPPAQPNPGGQAGQGDDGTPSVRELAERQERTEQKLDQTNGKLDQLLDRIGAGGLHGDRGGAGRQPAPAGQDPAGPADMQAQMRDAIRAVRAEDAAAEAARRQQQQTPAPEQQPREVAVRGKEKLQRVLFGGDPK